MTFTVNSTICYGYLNKEEFLLSPITSSWGRYCYHFLIYSDYVDRGTNSIEILCLLFALKIRYPTQVYLLRGNHESISMNQLYGFCDEIQRRFNPALYHNFLDVFSVMPIAALVSSRILCMHGGLSPELNSLDDIANIPRPYQIPDEGLVCDLLWSDPKRNQNQKWEPNERGVSYTFSEEVVKDFLEKFDLDLICRAHQVQDEGYSFFANGGMLTLFSAPKYVGEMDNRGAFLKVNKQLECTLNIIQQYRSVSMYALNRIFFEDEMEDEDDKEEETGERWYYAYDLDHGEYSIRT